MRRMLTALAAAVLLMSGVVASAAPVVAEDPQPTSPGQTVRTSPYVALGDSYSSAAEVLPLVAGAPPACSRSQLDYAHVIANVTRPVSFTDVTCSGASTSAFFTPQAFGLAPQLDAVTGSTRLVTMTIGGNDENVFVGMVLGCIAASGGNPYGNPCEQRYGPTFTTQIEKQTYPNLVRALTAVHEKGPLATVVILGYPRILPDTGQPACYPAMPIAMGDVRYLTSIEKALDDAVEKAAAATGTRFIDMWRSSATHDACQPRGVRWIEPFNGPVNAAPVHPNALGEAALAAQTLLQLGP